MDALLLEAEWRPKEEYRFSEQELATRSTYNGSMAFYNPILSMIDLPVPEHCWLRIGVCFSVAANCAPLAW